MLLLGLGWTTTVDVITLGAALDAVLDFAAAAEEDLALLIPGNLGNLGGAWDSGLYVTCALVGVLEVELVLSALGVLVTVTLTPEVGV